MSHLLGLQRLLASKHSGERGKLWSPITELNYVRLHQTPNAWGQPLTREGVMGPTRASVKALANAMRDVIASANSVVDFTSLDPPRGSLCNGVFWDAIKEGIQKLDASKTIRFLFGHPPEEGRKKHHQRFKEALASLYRRLPSPPTIILGFYARIGTTGPYFNHSKIVASDAGFAVVGGHNLYDSDYNQYPPVHDVSVEVHGPAAIDAQNFAAYLWEYGGIAAPSVSSSSWGGTALDVLSLGTRPMAKKLYKEAWTTIEAWGLSARGWTQISQSDYNSLFRGPSTWNNNLWDNAFSFQPDARKASILTVGRMGGWGHTALGDQNASDYMKGYLFENASRFIRISHQDLVAMDVGYGVQMQRVGHATCKDLAAALLRNGELQVQVVVSAPWGCGKMDAYTNVANGPQSAANYIMYYARKWGQGMVSSVSVPTSEYRVNLAPIWKRLQIAPFQFTNKLPDGNHFWPDAEREVEGCEGGITPPNYPKSVGNHCKVMIVDDTMVVGSDNHYPHPLAEINFVMEGNVVEEFKKEYWDKLWKYSMPSTVRQWSYDSALSNE